MQRRRQSPYLLALLAAAPFTLAPVATAQYDNDYYNDEEYEYESDEGVHEEEWYDPSDWFNDDGRIDYEEDGWGWGGYDPYYDDRYDYYDYDNGYGYDYYGDQNRYGNQHQNQYGQQGPDYNWSTYSDAYYDGYYDAMRQMRQQQWQRGQQWQQNRQRNWQQDQQWPQSPQQYGQQQNQQVRQTLQRYGLDQNEIRQLERQNFDRRQVERTLEQELRNQGYDRDEVQQRAQEIARRVHQMKRGQQQRTWQQDQQRRQNQQRNYQQDQQSRYDSPYWRDEYEYDRRQRNHEHDGFAYSDQGDYYPGDWYNRRQAERPRDQQQRDPQRWTRQRSQQRNMDAYADRNQTRSMNANLQRKSGTVEEMRLVDSSPLPKNHTVMMIDMEDGDEVQANFGPKCNRHQLPFSDGDRVTLYGDEIERDGESFFIVQSIEANGRQYTLRPAKRELSQSAKQRTWPNQSSRTSTQYDQEDRAQTQDRQQATITGTVSKVTAHSTDSGKSLFRIDLRDGQSRWILCDNNVSKTDLDLEAGDTISLRGTKKNVDGRSVIDVDSMRVNGERRDITSR